MSKETNQAILEILRGMQELLFVVTESNAPDSTRAAYKRIEDAIDAAHKHLARAEAK